MLEPCATHPPRIYWHPNRLTCNSRSASIIIETDVINLPGLLQTQQFSYRLILFLSILFHVLLIPIINFNLGRMYIWKCENNNPILRGVWCYKNLILCTSLILPPPAVDSLRFFCEEGGGGSPYARRSPPCAVVSDLAGGGSLELMLLLPIPHTRRRIVLIGGGGCEGGGRMVMTMKKKGRRKCGVQFFKRVWKWKRSLWLVLQGIEERGRQSN